jgi:succinate dehydrogenase/fumarate reductase cytochrome b subunit
MKQVSDDQVQDATVKRRRYLSLKCRTWIHRILGFGFAAIFFLLAGAIWFVAFQTQEKESRVTEYRDDRGESAIEALFVLTVPIAFIGLGVYGLYHLRDATEDAKEIAYVPPVAVQIAALPAEQVLVRCSAGPPAKREELLRAAQEGAVVPEDELLRGTGLLET